MDQLTSLITTYRAFSISYVVNYTMKTPFNMIIVVLTGCAKKLYLLSILEKEYMKHFDTIILLCPTFEWNKTYDVWKYKNDPDFLTIPCGKDDIDLILKYVVGIFKGTNSLIILDDCAPSQEIKNRANELVKLAFSDRHYGI